MVIDSDGHHGVSRRESARRWTSDYKSRIVQFGDGHAVVEPWHSGDDGAFRTRNRQEWGAVAVWLTRGKGWPGRPQPSVVAAVEFEGVGEDVAFDELCLSIGGLAQCSGGEPVDIPQA